MADLPNEQIERLRLALEEMRGNKAHFSDLAFTQIVVTLLDKLRLLQTAPHLEVNHADEIRLVTVMFVDVKDSTEIVQLVEAENWKNIIADTHARIADLVTQWDGQIGQYLGDGVLCFFGAQRSLGDDAMHAVACALAIQQSMETFAAEITRRYKLSFGMRIGISTGRVVVGMIGTTAKQELLALGPATNLAARLQAIAPTGGVVIDTVTFSRIRRNFIVQAQAPIVLKGFDEPIRYYQVLGRRTQSANQLAETHINGIPVPFLGRDEDLALIDYICVRALQEERSFVITITGDVGLGKSRLLQEVLQLTENRFNQIVMSANYDVRQNPHNLLRDMLDSQCMITPDTPIEEAHRLIVAYVTDLWDHPDAIHAASAIAYLAGYDFAAPPGNVYDWVISWFQGVAHQNALLIAVDNIQWADEQSVILLEQLALALSNEKTVIITTARPGYQTQHTNYMSSVIDHTFIPLEQLRPNATAMIITNVVNHVERVPPNLVDVINQRVEGNPLFVHEYLGMLFDTNVFAPISEGHWRFNIILYDTALTILPSGLINILQSRLDELTQEARQIIQIAAIAGQTFWADAIQTLSGNANTYTLLESLMMRGIILRDPKHDLDDIPAYTFRHTLYRDVAYEMLPRVQRESYHHEMANWLLGFIAGKANLYALLAEQFVQSNAYGASLYTYLEAVENAIARDDHERALALVDRSLAIANRVPREEALPIVCKLWAFRGQALLVLDRYEESTAASQSALMLLDELPAEQFITTRISIERFLGLAYTSLGRYNEAFDTLSRAHNLLPSAATGQFASVLRSFGTLYLYQGRLEDAAAYLKRSVVLAEKSGEIRNILASWGSIAVLEYERGNLAESLDYFYRTLEKNKERNHIGYHALDLRSIGMILLMLMQYQSAIECFDEATDLLASIGRQDMYLQAMRGLCMVAVGRQTQGRLLMYEAFERSHKDIYTQKRIQFIHILSLNLSGEYVQLREQALPFVHNNRSENPLMAGRGLMWLAVAANQLGDLNAYSLIKEALEFEEAYGGLELWHCHALVAQFSSNPAEKAEHYIRSADILIDRIRSLANYPDLQARIRETPIAQHIFLEAEKASRN